MNESLLFANCASLHRHTKALQPPPDHHPIFRSWCVVSSPDVDTSTISCGAVCHHSPIPGGGSSSRSCNRIVRGLSRTVAPTETSLYIAFTRINRVLYLGQPLGDPLSSGSIRSAQSRCSSADIARRTDEPQRRADHGGGGVRVDAVAQVKNRGSSAPAV